MGKTRAGGPKSAGTAPAHRAEVRNLVVALLLIALTSSVFWPVGDHPFTDLDDAGYVLHNRRVLAGWSWENVKWAFTSMSLSNWHPLTWLSHMTDVQLFGLDAGSHHRVSLALHAASTVVLYLLLARLTGAWGRSAVVAALFGVHPLHVESVAWVAERKDVLSGLFWMLGLASYLWFVRRRGWRRYAVVVAVFGLGLMAKPMLVTLPLVLVVLDWWPLGRLRGGQGPRAGDKIRQAGPLLEKVPLLLLSALSSLLTYLAQQQGGAVNLMAGSHLVEKAANALCAYVFYVQKTFWPDRLAIFYPFPDIRNIPWQIVGAAGILLAVSALAVRLRRRMPYVAMGWCWYLGVLFPVIGLVKVGAQAMADRYTYLPLIGLFWALTWAAHDILPRRLRAGVMVVAVPAVILSLSAAARQQVRLWSSNMTLFSHALAVTSDNWTAHFIVGDTLVREGKLNEGIAHYREVVRIFPENAEIHDELGMALAARGNTNEALAHHQEAMRLKPAKAGFVYNYARLLVAVGRTREGIAQYQRSLQLDPADAKAHNNLGSAYYATGRVAEALAHFKEALRLEPGMAEARQNYRIVLGSAASRK